MNCIYAYVVVGMYPHIYNVLLEPLTNVDRGKKKRKVHDDRRQVKTISFYDLKQRTSECAHARVFRVEYEIIIKNKFVAY